MFFNLIVSMIIFIISLIIFVIKCMNVGLGSNDTEHRVICGCGLPCSRCCGKLCGGVSTIDGTVSTIDGTVSTIDGGVDLQKDTLKKFKNLKVKKRPTFEEFCFPKSFSLQNQQIFAGEYMKPPGPKTLMIFHRIGAGKTCLSIQIGEKWKGKGKPLYIMPASLIPGFRNELRSKCAGDNYLTDDERLELLEVVPGGVEYKDIINRSDERIDQSYQILSYNKFATASKIQAPLIVIDEVQNINNPTGVYYKSVLTWIENNPRASVVIMSGTPIFDDAAEIYGLAKLLRIDSEVINPTTIPRLFAGKVSYYAGAPSYTFPEATIRIQKCKMSKHQRRWYTSEVEAEMVRQNIRLKTIANDFYIKSRQRSNIVYPNGLTGDAGLTALTATMIRNNLNVYSTKYAHLITKLKKNKLSFVYSGFTGEGGIAAITKCLRASGWSDYFEAGPGKRRYVVWSGDQTAREKDLIRATFNSRANDNASQIQVVIGSPSIKEGVSLLRVRQVHVMETYWNHSRLAQVYGRAVRYCSHKTLSTEDRNVMIYIYAATDGSKELSPLHSIDLYMLDIADKKREETDPIVRALIDVAVDKALW